jgi:serine/threonine protein kinase
MQGYQILETIYESPKSIVYKGKRGTDGPEVILKVLQENTQDIIQVNNEIEIAKLLDISGIRKAIETFKIDGKQVLVLEYIDGKTLKQILSEKHLNLKNCIKIVSQVAGILGTVHQNKVIHKDINPNNVIIAEDQKVYLIDFGISSRISLKISNLGNPDKIEGTLAYISPEQTGRMNRFVDHSTDLYSLGVTLYEMLTERLPFESDDPMELVHSHIAKPFPLPTKINSEIPQIIEQIILKLLSKNAEDRYQSAIGLKYDLDRFLNEETNFSLREFDFSGKFSIPQKLYGRDAEIQKLMMAFDRISQNSKQASKLELVLISGYSGVGKTALVHEIHKPITSQRGRFIEGKFDQFQRNIPYFGLTQAIEEFVQLILTYNETDLQFWRQQILESLGTVGKVLIDLVPSLEQLIGEQPEVPELEGAAAQNRFNSVLTNFLNAISLPEHPLVLFADDWQWADQPSIYLFETLLSSREIQNLLVIAAYRDNEVEPTHPFMAALQNIQKTELRVEKIQLENLSIDHLQNLLIDSLQGKIPFTSQSKEIIELSNLVYEKTGGNAFFIGQFLISLYEEELLKFDFTELVWKWNIDQIRSKGFTDNVVELMVQKIQKLPSDSAKVLQLASCIGNHFDLTRLSVITEQDEKITNESLEPAVLEGLIVPNHAHFKHVELSLLEYHFAHDRIQQAAYTLIPEEEKQQFI